MQKFTEILPEYQHTAVALGFFDGLHIGHRSVISLAVQEKKNGLLPVCFTFSQNPKNIILGTPENALMTDHDKEKMLEQLRIEHMIEADFLSIKDMTATNFFEEILVGRLKAKKIFCGFNYHFGKNGEGNSEMLLKLCKRNNIELVVVPPAKAQGQVVSSSLIRSLIQNGDINYANKLLCSRFGFSSTIEFGKQLGRKIGTPTINQPLCKKLVVPKYGVYVSAITLENGDIYCGVTNIGIKPTVGGTVPLCESWMPQYDGGEIYGQTADVRLIDFLRDEKKFASIEELKNAIAENGRTALKIFENQT
ncbi:MAG: riboflavin biosynthesis protein RibF [Ruminococcus sp.]|nr:riboflavin biosynthesis protein RibF [Ruminococcus sp.]